MIHHRDRPRRDLFGMRARDTGPSKGNSQLRAEQRQDKDGKVVTRWVKDGKDNAPCAALASQGVVSSAHNPVPTNVDWNAASSQRVMKLCESAADGLTDPEKVWDNFDFYTGLLESKHSDLGLAAMSNDEVGPKLRDAWITKHGAKFEDPSTYRGIEGDEGYEAYKEAFANLRVAGEAARVNWAFSDFGLEKEPPGTSEHWDKIRADNTSYIAQKREAESNGTDFDPLEKFRNEVNAEAAPRTRSFLDAMHGRK